jgi:hypothetical protein
MLNGGDSVERSFSLHDDAVYASPCEVRAVLNGCETGSPSPKEKELQSFGKVFTLWGRLCGLVVRVPGCSLRGPGFDSRCYQIS